MSRTSNALDAYGYVFLTKDRPVSEQLAWSQLMQAEQTQAVVAALGGLADELAEIREVQHEGLAIQQEMLRRDEVQAHLEEFIYNMQKMVAAFSADHGDTPSTVRYFSLRGVRESVARNGIATPLIRGRENKAAFEETMESVKRMLAELGSDSDVKDALVWAKAEEERRRRIAEANKQRRLEEERKQQQAEKRRQEEEARRKAEIADRKVQLSKRIAILKASRRSIGFSDWYGQTFDSYLNRKPPFDQIPFLSTLPEPVYKLLATIILWGPMPFGVCYGCVWIPIKYSIARKRAEEKLNPEVDGEIVQLERELATLG